MASGQPGTEHSRRSKDPASPGMEGVGGAVGGGRSRWTGGRPPWTSEVTARRPAFVLTEKGSHGRVLGVTWVAGSSLRLLCGPQTSRAEGAEAQLGGYCGRLWCERRVPKMSVGFGKRSQCDSLENPMIHPKAPNIWPLITT